MPRRRPGSFVALAVFNFIIGGLSLLCGLFGFNRYTMTVNNQDVTPVFEAFMERELPSYPVYRRASAVANVALGFGFIASGVGLLGGWGRIFALVCGSLSLVHQVGVAVFQLFFVGPAFNRFFSQAGPIGFFGDFLSMVVVAWAIAVAIYDIVLITVTAMRSAPAARDVPEDYDDHPPRRRRYEDEPPDEPRRRRPAPDVDEDAFEERPRPRAREPYYEEEPPRRRRPVDDDDDPEPGPRRPRRD
jgi:hypothetical protein